MAMTELRKPTRPPRQSRTTRRVTLNVDEELLREAGEFLGTTSMTETINGALDEYVSLQMRLQLVNHDFDLTPEMLDEIRRPRTF
jgi:Arc/MetJ family transcription regulator